MVNPDFAGYFEAKLASKPRPHRSSSECLPNPLSQHQQNHRQTEKQSNPTHTPRSHSNSNIVMQHEKLVDPQRLAKGDRNYSAKVNYKMPNINYSTAMRSSKRPRQRDEESEHGYFNNKRWIVCTNDQLYLHDLWLYFKKWKAIKYLCATKTSTKTSRITDSASQESPSIVKSTQRNQAKSERQSESS